MGQRDAKRQRREIPPKGAQSSHYEYRNWLFDDEERRVGAAVVKPLSAASSALIGNYYNNKATGTYVVYSLTFDLNMIQKELNHVSL